MENVINIKKCTGCMACKNICPKEAINIEISRDGFMYPQIDRDKCINCGLCKKVCPIINKLNNNENITEVYGCKNKNEEIRMKSSSGGIFSLIAEQILNQNGIVFGARFNENLQVVHDYIECIEDLEQFRGSKYVQSQINDTYKKVKNFLSQNRKVLFTGTPCQVEGLMGYLGKEYENLYTQDVICHGVPSPKVWEKYLEYKKEQIGEYPENVTFRKKELLGWSNFQVCYKYSNSEENIHHANDPFMKIFLRNFILRKSCYDCQFKKIKRNSDITIADFWGINEVVPEFNDEKGVSTILINSKKGKKIFEDIKEKIEFVEINIEDVVKHNSPICKSVDYNNERDNFFEDLEKENFAVLIEKYLEKL